MPRARSLTELVHQPDSFNSPESAWNPKQPLFLPPQPPAACLPASLALFKQDESRLCLDSKASDLSPVPENRLARQPGLKVSCFLALGLSDFQRLGTIGISSSQKSAVKDGICPWLMWIAWV